MLHLFLSNMHQTPFSLSAVQCDPDVLCLSVQRSIKYLRCVTGRTTAFTVQLAGLKVATHFQDGIIDVFIRRGIFYFTSFFQFCLLA